MFMYKHNKIIGPQPCIYSSKLDHPSKQSSNGIDL